MKGDIIDPQAMGKLMQVLPSLPLRNRVLIELMAWTGLRRKEVGNLDVQDVALGPDPGLWVRRLKKRRLVQPELVRVPAALADLLRRHIGLRREGPLFLSRRGDAGGRLTDVQIARVVAAVGRRAGLKIHPHSFRHWQGTAYQHVSHDAMATMKRLGHSDLKSALVYQDGWGREDRAAVEAVYRLAAGVTNSVTIATMP